MPLFQTVPPAIEPLTVADVKSHARIDTNDDDQLITNFLIPAARQKAELLTRRSFITQQWLAVLDAFPGSYLTGVPFGQTFGIPPHAVLLERPPILSIQSIKYTAMDGTTGTMNPATDFVDLTFGATVRADNLMRITPQFGKIWPITLPQIGSVQIAYTAGYGPLATSVPATIRNWMLLRVAALYENREEVIVGTRIVVAELPYIDGLLDEYIVGTT